MDPRSQLRGLAAAAALAVAVISLPSGTALARDNGPVDNGVRCGYYSRDAGGWIFYLPGESIVVYDANGHSHIVECGEDGHWHAALTTKPGSATNHVNPGAPVSQP